MKHSRVARSTATALTTLGVAELRLVAPENLMPEAAEFPGAKRHTALEDGIRGADVIMTLRIQRERMSGAPDPDAFCREWGITEQNLPLAAPGAVVLHPGPDESRRGNLERHRGRTAIGHPAAGAQRGGRAHGRAGYDRAQRAGA